MGVCERKCNWIMQNHLSNEVLRHHSQLLEVFKTGDSSSSLCSWNRKVSCGAGLGAGVLESSLTANRGIMVGIPMQPHFQLHHFSSPSKLVREASWLLLPPRCSFGAWLSQAVCFPLFGFHPVPFGGGSLPMLGLTVPVSPGDPQCPVALPGGRVCCLWGRRGISWVSGAAPGSGSPFSPLPGSHHRVSPSPPRSDAGARVDAPRAAPARPDDAKCVSQHPPCRGGPPARDGAHGREPHRTSGAPGSSQRHVSPPGAAPAARGRSDPPSGRSPPGLSRSLGSQGRGKELPQQHSGDQKGIPQLPSVPWGGSPPLPVSWV
ncbi:PREDICTED: vegetative cell wall protein gp1-like [Lepidothrix coronata]|uniref:Vegetative cell wall protein gp1-like n=1 Tax=Lepidothrix coronata TaxID=321398 RepID=A0A6J0J004_9PASS|nr:PREDICTED: vegetative cell wall protein gp1-like [Lepidothrix coronata]